MDSKDKCWECGNPAMFVDIKQFYMYCLPCIREMYPALKERVNE